MYTKLKRGIIKNRLHMIRMQVMQQSTAAPCSRQALLLILRHHEGKWRRPDKGNCVTFEFMMQVQMAGGDQAKPWMLQDGRQ